MNFPQVEKSRLLIDNLESGHASRSHELLGVATILFGLKVLSSSPDKTKVAGGFPW